MLIEIALISLIKTIPSVISTIGVDNLSKSVYPSTEVKSNASTPRVTVQRLAIRDGAILTDDGYESLSRAKFQINSIADTYLEAATLSNRVRMGIGAYSGTSEGIKVKVIVIEAEGDLPSTTQQAGAAKPTFGRRLDVTVVYEDAV